MECERGEGVAKQGSIPTRARLFALAGIAVVVGNFLSTLPAHTHTHPATRLTFHFRALLCACSICANICELIPSPWWQGLALWYTPVFSAK